MSEPRNYALYPETALRFHVKKDSKVVLRLEQGEAEIFGSELTLNHDYTFDEWDKITIFTWPGCKLVIEGETETEKVIKETPMVIYASIHASIEQLRQNAEACGGDGPVVLVVGPIDSGKSTMCRTLLNYAVRQGRTPVFVDLDVGQGELSVPGTMASILMDSQSDIEEGFMIQMPMVFHYGHKSPGHNDSLYKYLIQQLSKSTKSRTMRSYNVNASGVIINSCGWIKSQGYHALTQAVFDFEVNVVLVLGKEYLYYQLVKDVPPFVKVVYVPTFQGIVERSRLERIESCDNRVSQYFYGRHMTLTPYTIQVSFDDIKIFKILQAQEPIPRNVTKLVIGGFILVQCVPSFSLVNHLLCVTFSKDIDEEMFRTNIAGFVCVMEVHMNRRELTLLSPNPPPLPDVVFLHGNITFPKVLQPTN